MIWHVFAMSNRTLESTEKMWPGTRRWLMRWHVRVRYDPAYSGGMYYYAPLIFGWLGWLSDRIDRGWRKVSSPVLRWGRDRRFILRDWNEAMMIPRCWRFVYSPFGMLNEWVWNTDRWWCREVRK